MLYALILAAAIISAIQAIRSKRLITSALWLAGVSALLSVFFYLMRATLVAVIELSVGAGLVTVLFVFAISVAGEEGMDQPSLLPKPLAWILVCFSALFLGWFLLPETGISTLIPEPSLATIFWEYRGLDVLIQVVLIFSGVLGLLGLLAEAKAPLDHAVADEIAAQRDKALREMEAQDMDILKTRETKS
jgi:NADH:ubiquinone oxidoreductase subunit 6 (subunit J)